MTDSTPPAPPRPHRPLPIEWATAETLAGHAQSIAKGWLLLLLERAPLDAVGAIPAAELAAEGPAICAAAARALGSDVELARIGATDVCGEQTGVAAVAALAERAAEVATVLAATAITAVEAESTAVPPAATPQSSASLVPDAGAVPAVHDLRDGGEQATPGSVTELPARPATDPRSCPAASMDDSELWIATLERHVDR